MYKERTVIVNLRSSVPGITDEMRAAHIEGHRTFLSDLEKSGKLLMHGRFADKSGAIQMFDTDSLEEVEQLMQKDPFSKHGLIQDNLKVWPCKVRE